MWINASLDFGNEGFVLAVPGNSVNVVPAADGGRVVPAMVTYAGSRRYFGADAQRERSAHLSGTINELKRLLCLPYDSKERELIEQKTPLKLCEIDDGLTGVVVPFLDREVGVRPEQILAYALKKIDEMAKGYNEKVGGYVVMVPPSWNETRRRAILDAFRIAGLRCTGLVNSTTAAVAAYTMMHGGKLSPDKAVPALFVDIGSSSMNVAVANVKQGSVEMLSQASDPTLGGSDFTDALQAHLLECVQEKYGVDPTNDKKAMIRFRAAVEKLKKMLSVNPVVQFEVQSLVNDVDVSLLVKREEFVEKISSLVERVHGPIEQALELSGVKKEDLAIVEALGGGSRVPAVRAKITELIGKEPTQSLNLEECFAIGGAYIAGLLSPGMFKIPLVVKDISYIDVHATWVEDEEKSSEIFKVSEAIPAVGSLALRAAGACEVKLTSNDQEVAVVKIDTQTEEPVDVLLRLRLTASTTLEIESATYKKDDANVPVPIVSMRYSRGISNEKLEEMQALEQEMTGADAMEVKIDETLNDVDSLMFKLEKVIVDQAQFFSPDELKEAQELSNSIKEWHDENEFERLALEAYESKRETLQGVLDPILKRVAEYDEILEKVTELLADLDKVHKDLMEDKQHAEDEDMSKIQEEIVNVKAQIDEFKSKDKWDAQNFDLASMQNAVTAIGNKQKELKAKPVQVNKNTENEAPDTVSIQNNHSDDESCDSNKNHREDDLANMPWGWGPFFGMPPRNWRGQEQIRKSQAQAQAQAAAAERQRRLELERKRQQELLERRKHEEEARKWRGTPVWSDPWGTPQPRRQPQRPRQSINGWGNPWGRGWNNGFF